MGPGRLICAFHRVCRVVWGRLLFGFGCLLTGLKTETFTREQMKLEGDEADLRRCANTNSYGTCSRISTYKKWAPPLFRVVRRGGLWGADSRNVCKRRLWFEGPRHMNVAVPRSAWARQEGITRHAGVPAGREARASKRLFAEDFSATMSPDKPGRQKLCELQAATSSCDVRHPSLGGWVGSAEPAIVCPSKTHYWP